MKQQRPSIGAMQALECKPLTHERDTLIAALKRAAAANPDKLFLDFDGQGVSYAQIFKRACQLANGLADHGIVPGDTVATMLDNGEPSVVVWFAANLIGAIHVPINTSYKAEFLRHQIDDCAARLVVVDSHYLERFFDIADSIPHVQTLATVGDDVLGQPAALARQGKALISLAALVHKDATAPAFEPKPSDIACLIYTSGTSGRSKGCMLSHNFLCHVGHQFNWFSGRVPADHNWTALPLFHLNAVAGTVVATVLLQGSASIAPKFSLSAFWPEILRTRPKVVYLVGAMIALIAKADDTPEMKQAKGIIRTIIAAPCPEHLKVIFRERFGIANVGGAGFGQTEIGMPFMLPPFFEQKAGTNGKLTPAFEAQIVDEDDCPLPVGSVGEIAIRPLASDIIFQGYWRRPVETLDAFRNLWYHTGDLGRFDADGYFYFLDRKKDYLRRGGENISSFELEVTFAQHPAIAEVAVHSVVSEQTEDEVKVTAVLAPGEALDEPTLCQWSIDKLPRFAIPRYIEFRDALPRNPVGRVLKYQLRNEGVTASTWDRVQSGLALPAR